MESDLFRNYNKDVEQRESERMLEYNHQTDTGYDCTNFLIYFKQ